MTELEGSSPAKSAIAGSIAGGCAVVSGYPFDTVKTLLQVNTSNASFRPENVGMLQYARRILRTQGLAGFFKGMGVSVAVVSPLCSVWFFGYSFAKQFLQKFPGEELRLCQLFLAGAFAGCVTVPFVSPVERIKCLLQIQSVTGQQKYGGPVDCIRQIYQTESLPGVYRGTCATIIRDVPAAGLYFMLYEWLQRLLVRRQESPSRFGVLRTTVAGGVTGIAVFIIEIPADVLKTRLQTAPQGLYPRGVRDVFSSLMKHEGIMALYKGATPLLLRAAPVNAALFIGYELTMQALNCLLPHV